MGGRLVVSVSGPRRFRWNTGVAVRIVVNYDVVLLKGCFCFDWFKNVNKITLRRRKGLNKST